MREPSRVGVRLRQAVLVSGDLDDALRRLRETLGLGEPFRDPGVAHFGLRNAVCALGADFLEVVAPSRPGTAAGRELDRRGEGGYMVLFQVDDLEGARARAEALAVRTVWQIDVPDISATHLHPSDLGGTIVSLDRPDPPESWRWGGPAWTGGAGPGAPGRLAGVTISVPEPEAVAARWARVLGVAPGPVLELDGGQQVAFVPGAAGLHRIAVEIPDARRRPCGSARRALISRRPERAPRSGTPMRIGLRHARCRSSEPHPARHPGGAGDAERAGDARRAGHARGARGADRPGRSDPVPGAA